MGRRGVTRRLSAFRGTPPQPRGNFTMKPLVRMISAALALVLQSGFAGAYASSTSTSGHCTGMTVTDYTSSWAENITASEAWQNVTDAHVNFTTSATGCVIITFSGPAVVTAATDS